MEIKSLQELADYINQQDSYPFDVVQEACRANGWDDLSDEGWMIAGDCENVCMFDDNVNAIVVKKIK